MLIDNNNKKLFDFLKTNVGNGSLDVMVGYFSISALAFMRENLNQSERVRLIFGNLPREGVQSNRIIDLLGQTISVPEALLLTHWAKQAIEFLRQDKVQVRWSRTHAKLYLYKDSDPSKNFHLLGSSNLTEAGLGLKQSSHTELNKMYIGDNEDYKECKQWFDTKWNEAHAKIKLSDGRELTVKQYVIELIENFVKEYEPEVLYNKTLYELLKNNLLKITDNEYIKRDIINLKETVIYQKLFPHQEKGAISLIRILEEYNGAILADSVGLGKTPTALAVMKYFQMRGYTIVVFCPKRLRNNWELYKAPGSLFQQDELEYYVRNHTDLQNGRLDSDAYCDFPLSKLKQKQKVLVVIDESHNFRNDGTLRYEFLVNEVLMPQKLNRDVKVLLISATPINNSFMDLYSQIKLIARGRDDGFKNTPLRIDNLYKIFKEAQKISTNIFNASNEVSGDDLKKLLPDGVKKLIEELIIARNRKAIESQLQAQGMSFPEKEPPINEFIPIEIGELKTIEAMLNTFPKWFAAYRPAEYIDIEKAGSLKTLKSDRQRQESLSKIMYILLVKRLESSWFSLKITVQNILNYNIEVLNKVNKFLEQNIDASIEFNFEDDEEMEEIITENNGLLTIGKKKPVLISLLKIDEFKKHLEEDIAQLSCLMDILSRYEAELKAGNAQDNKLNRLQEYIINKLQHSENKKVIVFTVYEDTARYLYNELKKKLQESLKGTGIMARIALVTGSTSETYDGYSSNNFQDILERFAPNTKIFKEKDPSEWSKPETQYKLQNQIDILIATDCISEGQNLQDCDTIINYDIHWNPVRLIQRIGRIDRIGSPNKTIKGVNFWPGQDYEEFLGLKRKVEERMNLMTVVSNTDSNLLVSKQNQEVLDKMQTRWVDIEEIQKDLKLTEFSLESFRYEFFDLLEKNMVAFTQIPIGAFSGFRIKLHSVSESIPNSMIAVLGYPKRSGDTNDYSYHEIYLLHISIEDDKLGELISTNQKEILTLLKLHKSEPRYVPEAIDNGDEVVLSKLAEAIRKGLDELKTYAVNQVSYKFILGEPISTLSDEEAVEDKFNTENFDLITWFVISNE